MTRATRFSASAGSLKSQIEQIANRVTQTARINDFQTGNAQSLASVSELSQQVRIAISMPRRRFGGFADPTSAPSGAPHGTNGFVIVSGDRKQSGLYCDGGSRARAILVRHASSDGATVPS